MERKNVTTEKVKITFENETTGDKFYIHVHELVMPDGQAECGHLFDDGNGGMPNLHIDVSKVGSLHTLQAQLFMHGVNAYYYGALNAKNLTQQKHN